jgi:hypothetical protein
MSKQKPGQKAFQRKVDKRLPTENEQRVRKNLLDKDESLLKEIKRLQKRLYKEYEITEWGEESEDG